MKTITTLLLATFITLSATVHAETYAEKLGFPKGARVAIFHSDDLGMFYDSDEGTKQSVENGIVTSASTMMPTGWVTHWAKWLKENPDFCSENRRKEWLEDINNLLEKSTPQTVFGVLGNTGVGKSSLLNSLLDEAAVLPTSGSRGCTATVVELLFHSELIKEADDEETAASAKAVPEPAEAMTQPAMSLPEAALVWQQRF